MELNDDELEAYNTVIQEMDSLPHIHDFTQRVIELLTETSEDHNRELLDLACIIDSEEHWRRFAERKGLGSLDATSVGFEADLALDGIERAFGKYIKQLLECIVAAKLVRYKSEFCNAKHEGRVEELPVLAAQVHKYQELSRQFPHPGLKRYLEYFDGPQQ